jgi:hypothetical protein
MGLKIDLPDWNAPEDWTAGHRFVCSFRLHCLIIRNKINTIILKGSYEFRSSSIRYMEGGHCEHSEEFEGEEEIRSGL